MSTKGKNHAFPLPPETPGLTKREYLAALALQGLLANSSLTDEEMLAALKKQRLDVATMAVAAADALLAKLEKSK